jgi:hypothetical protein
MLSLTKLRVNIFRSVMLSVIMLIVFMLSLIMLRVIMLCSVMLNAMSPKHSGLDYKHFVIVSDDRK